MDLFVDTTLYGYGIAGVEGSDKQEPLFIEIDTEKRGSGVGGQLQKILDQHKVSWESVENIFISSGPGSFTGIKVGLAWAYGVQRGCQHPLSLTPYSGLQMAAAVFTPGESLVLPSTRSRGFVATSDGELAPVESESFQADGQKLYVIGQWPTFEERFPGAIVLDRREVLLQSLKQAIIHRKNFSVDSRPQAHYMRRSTAEENLK